MSRASMSACHIDLIISNAIYDSVKPHLFVPLSVIMSRLKRHDNAKDIRLDQPSRQNSPLSQYTLYSGNKLQLSLVYNICASLQSLCIAVHNIVQLDTQTFTQPS